MPDHPELIPGTTLPIVAPGASVQAEGRGTVQIIDDRAPVSLLEKIENGDGLNPHEMAMMEAAIRGFDRAPRNIRNIDSQVSGQTDATTGNFAAMLYECPQGSEMHVVNVTVDAPGSSTITPAAPYANAASYAFLAKAPPSTSPSALGLRPGLIAFAPTTSTGPIVPGQWAFDDSNARIVFGGQALFYVIVGGSIAGIRGVQIQVGFRVNIVTRTTSP